MKNEFIRELARFRRGFNAGKWRRAKPLATKCAVCNGTGLVQVWSQAEQAYGVVECRYCGGEGEEAAAPSPRRFQCERCGGTGRQQEGKYDGRQQDAGECSLCGGEGLLGEMPKETP